jgi:hypothetical protein
MFDGGDGALAPGDKNGGVLQHKGDEGKVMGAFIRRERAWRCDSLRRSGDGGDGSNSDDGGGAPVA